MRNLILIVTTLFLFSCGTVDPRVIVYVGSVKRDCSQVVNQRQLVTVPVGLKLSPVEAAQKLATCSSKFGYSVYADDSNYYFVDNNKIFLRNVDTDLILKNAIVVNGNTGEKNQKTHREN